MSWTWRHAAIMSAAECTSDRDSRPPSRGSSAGRWAHRTPPCGRPGLAEPGVVDPGAELDRVGSRAPGDHGDASHRRIPALQGGGDGHVEGVEAVDDVVAPAQEGFPGTDLAHPAVDPVGAIGVDGGPEPGPRWRARAARSDARAAPEVAGAATTSAPTMHTAASTRSRRCGARIGRLGVTAACTVSAVFVARQCIGRYQSVFRSRRRTSLYTSHPRSASTLSGIR